MASIDSLERCIFGLSFKEIKTNGVLTMRGAEK